MLRVIDTENYSNLNLIMLRDIDTGKVTYFEQYPGKPFDLDAVRAALTEGTLIGFNSNRYDLPILKVALSGADCATIKKASDDIILNEAAPWHIERNYATAPLDVDHIDISEPTPGVMVSLKSYAGRINAPKMQDLPIEPNATITPAQRGLLRQYCINDLDVTEKLYRTIEERIHLREQMSQQYGIDLRSKSDAQVAEAVIRHEVEILNGKEVVKPTIKPGTTYRYRAQGFIQFHTKELQAVHAKVKSANYAVAENGSIDIPQELADLKIKIGGSTYQMGIGGLHSTEKSVCHVTDNEYVLLDHDVASYYPNVILRQNLFPQQMGGAFLTIYKTIIVERLAAKQRVKELKAEIEAIEKELAHG